STIDNFTQIGIDMTTGGRLTVKHTTIANVLAGVRVNGSGTPRASLNDVTITNAFNGVDTFAGSTSVYNSVIAHSAWFGLIAEGGELNGTTVTLPGNNGPARPKAGG